MTNSNRSESRPFLSEYEVEIVEHAPLNASVDETSSEATHGTARVLGSTKVTRVRDETTDDE